MNRIHACDWLAGDPAAHALALRRVLQGWAGRGWLRALDVAFADFLWREVPQAPALLVLAAALASHQLGRGHASLDLAAVLDDPAQALSLPPDGVPSASYTVSAGVTADDAQPPAPLPGELVAGHSPRTQIRMVGPEENMRAVLALIKAELPSANVFYWLVPVIEMGRL